ncbi:MAG: AMP-binding protein [Chthoniobacteraceae bacterium]
MRPHAAAIVERKHGRDRITTFSELEDSSAKIAALLRQMGIRKGDPILVFQPMSSDLYAVLLGIFRLGAIAMFLDPSAGRGHINRCCGLLVPRALIAVPKAHLLRAISAALRCIPVKFATGFGLPGAVPLSRSGMLPALHEIAHCDDDTPALVTFTSGSTGLPKAAVRTHGFLLAQHDVLERSIQLVPGEVDLTTLPVFLLANLASGVTSVIPDADLRKPGAINPEPVLSQITRHRVTRCAASPAFFECLLSADDSSRISMQCMKKIFTGGAPVFPRLLDQLAACAPEASVDAVYGSTEAEPIAHIPHHEIMEKDREDMRHGNGLIAGWTIPEIGLRIIRDQWGKQLGPFQSAGFEQMQQPIGSIGEIVVTGDHVLKSYLHHHGDEETKFSVNGQIWHRTGDAGKLDSLGRLWLLGRCAAKIKDDRGEIYPFAVECVAMKYARIKRAACLLHKEKRLLIVEPGPGFTETEKEALCEDLEWADLDAVRTVKHIPVDKRHNAKIDFPALRKILG